jgi:SAM-dependent MidA family methyltransferase
MELALYHPQFGYYARAVQRSGRAGDFFTSVDVGPLFGELLEVQLAEMARILSSEFRIPTRFDLVEAGAGNGRLSADILRSARRTHPEFYESIQLHLVETSGAARAAQRDALADVADRLVSSASTLPAPFEGTLIANELLDAMPVHQVVMRENGLREVYIDVARLIQDRDRGAESSAPHQQISGPQLVSIEGPPSTPALAEYLQRVGAKLEPGWRAEINLRAVDWIADAARRLRRGFMILIDYGHEARELYSASHAAGTLTTFSGHRSAGPESAGAPPPWLREPGEHDITSHVDFSSVRAAAEQQGLQTLGFLDQTYFLLGLLQATGYQQSISNPQSVPGNLKSLKTLIMPGGLGSTFKVMLFGKGVGTPALAGCSYRVRVT